MSRQMIHFALWLALSLGAVWLFMGYLLPIGLPFLLGISLALGAEPAARLLSRQLGLPRGVASPLAVSGVCLLSTTVVTCLLALLVRQSQQVMDWLPAFAESVTDALSQLQAWLQDLAQRLPPALQPLLGGLTEDFFQNGGALLEQAAIRLPKLATAVLGVLSKGMLGLITGIISAYMISARMPQLQPWWQSHQPKQWQKRWSPLLKTMQKSLSGWVIAELKLALLGFGFMAAGFWLLGIRRSLVLAGLIAIVDAFPILGVGTVLIPWALICLLRRQTVRGIGLLAVYAVVWLARSILEPKLVGKGLGLDPLVTLVAIYAGWKLWGIGGMLLAPILALTVAQVLTQWRVES